MSADPILSAVRAYFETTLAAHGATARGVDWNDEAGQRLRHRQFGVLVTTSHLDTQAYTEIREDAHPVIVLAARDITDSLKTQGLNNTTALRQHLHDKHPPR